jgi:hypothetical protein
MLMRGSRWEGGRGEARQAAISTHARSDHCASCMCQAAFPSLLPCMSCLQAVQNNASLYVHVLFASAGLPIDHTDPEYNEGQVFGSVHSE